MNFSTVAISLIAILSANFAFANDTFEFVNSAIIEDEDSGSVSVQLIRTGSLGQVDVEVYGQSCTATSTSDSLINGDDPDFDLDTSEPIDVTFAAGQTTRTISIPLLDDSWSEDDEYFSLALRGGDGVNLGEKRTIFVTIRDDEFSSSAPPVEPLKLIVGTDSVQLLGTADDDIFCVRPNGWSSFQTPTVPESKRAKYWIGESNATILAGFGVDTVEVRSFDPADISTAVLRPGSFQYTTNRSGEVFRWDGVAVETIDIVVASGTGPGDGEDRAFIFDSPGDDLVDVAPAWALIESFSASMSNKVRGFDKTVVYGSTGIDYAVLHDTPGDDVFTAKPTHSTMTGMRTNTFPQGSPDTPYVCYISGFKDVRGSAARGGNDVAHLYDSPANDTYTGTAQSGVLSGTDYAVTASRFKSIGVYSVQGGSDNAFLYDSPGNDIFVGRESSSAIFDSPRTFAHTVKWFANVEAISDAGGSDVAQFYDSTGDDHFLAQPGTPTLTTDVSTVIANGFSFVYAFSTNGGFDTLDQLINLDYFFRRSGNWQ